MVVWGRRLEHVVLYLHGAPQGTYRSSEGFRGSPTSCLQAEQGKQLLFGKETSKDLLMSEQPPEMVEITEEERLVAVTFAKGRYPG